MSSLWKKEFKAENIRKPVDILEEQAELLAEMTDGRIIAKVEGYEGPIHSGKMGGTLKLSISALTEYDYDVQDDLGEIEGSNFRYEFYITSVMTPNFKYRIMFFEHDITFYPVRITLDETIANELDLDVYIGCDSLREFIKTLTMILNSKKIESVINALLSIENNN